MVVAVLLRAGNHEPVIPLVDVVCKADKTPPEQIGATAAKVGVTLAVTFIIKVVVVAH